MAMKNKKTTVSGFLLLGGAVLYCVGVGIAGGDIGKAITEMLIPALAGLGLMGAGDGGL